MYQSNRFMLFSWVALIVALTCVPHAPAVIVRPLAIEGWKGPESRTLPLPSTCVISGRVGRVGGSITCTFGDGSQGAQLSIRGDDTPSGNQHWHTTPIPEDAGLKDGALVMNLSGAGVPVNRVSKLYYIRPDIHFYVGEDFEEAKGAWNTFASASEHVFALECRHRGDWLELWIDGRYFSHVELQEGWSEVRITPSEGAEVLGVHAKQDPEDLLYLPVNIGANRNQGRAVLSSLALDDTLESVSGAPLHPVALAHAVDVGLARWLRQEKDSGSFYDPYYKRSTWDNLAETIIFRVPARFYTTAHVLCAVDPAESPTMGVRIGRYRQKWDGSGMTQGDTNVRIDPGHPEGLQSIREVGSVKIARDGATVSAPVYVVAIPLRTGEVADYLEWQGLNDDGGDWGDPLDWLMIEFTRTLHTRVTVNNGIFEKKPLGARSGVHVLALALEKSPVEIRVTSDEPGFSFYKDKEPALTIETVNPLDTEQDLALTATVTDFDGAEKTIRKAIKAAPGQATTSLDLSNLDVGWYNADLSFADLSGYRMWSCPVTFALLPPDTRHAGIESPFGTWWFRGAHYTDPQADHVLPLIEKMGFRHVTPPPPNDKRNAERGITPENFARHKITPSMMGTIRRGDPAEQIKEFYEAWPTTEFKMIFHETSVSDLGLDLPYELTGAEPTELQVTEDTAGGRDRVDSLKQFATERAALIRKLAPDTKIMLGNGGTLFNVLWFREKLPREVWDCCGMEMAVQAFHPEGQPTGWNLQSLWIAKRMREIYGYDDFPIASCYEFDYRCTAPGALSLKRQADWYARDALHCLAYRMPSVNIALIADCNSSYFTSRWGSTGVHFRSPLHMPKPSFVSLATMTRMLDGAEYQRWLDTGSTGVYCLEFRNADGFVYAVWSGRGKRPITVSKGLLTRCRLVDSMGRPDDLRGGLGKISFVAGESPSYLATTGPISGIRLGEPEYDDVALSDETIISAMERDGWRLVQQEDVAFADYCAYKPMAPGKITLTPALSQRERGGVRGGGLRLNLAPQPDVADIIARYAILEPSDGPIAIPGTPNAVGIWVNGSADWGRVYFAFEDAEGRRWTSNGWEEAPHSWDMSDWEADTSINHDGWRFIHVKLPSLYPCGYYRPECRHWRCQGDNSKDIEPVYPLKFARVYMVMRESLVYLTDMMPARSLTVGLRDLTVGSTE